MPSSRSWRDEVYFRFNPKTVSKEFGIPIENVEDFQIFVVSNKPLDLEMAYKMEDNQRVYPTYLKNINSVLEKINSVVPENFWKIPPSIRVKGRDLNFKVPAIMSVINMTPDSFYPGSRYSDENVEERLSSLSSMGIDIVDIGGESTRPRSDPITAEDEMARVKGAVKIALSKGLTVSVDTYRPEVAKECLEMGVHMINDVTGMQDREMGRLARKYEVPLIIMHSLGDFKHMQDSPHYENVIGEILYFFYQRIRLARKLGIEDNIILDPGIGFGKRFEDNLAIINNLRSFRLGHPLMIGLSRKSFIGTITGEDVNSRDISSLILNTLAAERGADIIRVHDVEESLKLTKIIKKLKENQI